MANLARVVIFFVFTYVAFSISLGMAHYFVIHPPKFGVSWFDHKKDVFQVVFCTVAITRALVLIEDFVLVNIRSANRPRP